MGKKYVRHREGTKKNWQTVCGARSNALSFFFLLSPGNNNKFWSIRRIFCTLLPWIHSISLSPRLPLSVCLSSYKRSSARYEYTLYSTHFHFGFALSIQRAKYPHKRFTNSHEKAPLDHRVCVCVHLYPRSSIKMSLLFVVNIFEENSSFAIPHAAATILLHHFPFSLLKCS